MCEIDTTEEIVKGRFTIIFSLEGIKLDFKEDLFWKSHSLGKSSNNIAFLDASRLPAATSPRDILLECSGLVLEEDDDCFLVYSDMVGKLPIFYSRTRKEEVVLSDFLPDLLARTESNYDPIGAAEFLLFEACLEGRTLYESVKRVSPGFCLKVKKRDFSCEMYPWFNFDTPVNESLGYEDALEAFDSALDAAIGKVQSYPHKGIVFPLSGGIDSHLTLYYLMKHALVEPSTFTYGFSPVTLEYFFAKKVAKAIGVAKPKFHQLGSRAYTDTWNKLVFESAGMLAGSNAHTLDFILNEMNRDELLVSNMGSDAACGWAVELCNREEASKQSLHIHGALKKAESKNWFSPDTLDGINYDLDQLVDRWRNSSTLGSPEEYYYVTVRHSQFHNYLSYLWGLEADVLAPYLSPIMYRNLLAIPPRFKIDKRLSYELLHRKVPALKGMSGMSSLHIEGRAGGDFRRGVFRACNFFSFLVSKITQDRVTFPNPFVTECIGKWLRTARYRDLQSLSQQLFWKGVIQEELKNCAMQKFYRSSSHATQARILSFVD